MSATIESYKGISNGANVTLGPFRNVEIGHRRIVGDGIVVALRHVDGLRRRPTESSGAAFLAARVSVGGARTATFRLVKGWKPGSDFERPIREVRLQGDHLYLGSQAAPFAHTVEDARIWQTRADGLAYEAATIAA